MTLVPLSLFLFFLHCFSFRRFFLVPSLPLILSLILSLSLSSFSFLFLQLAITTPDGDLAGDIVQSLAEFLGIEVGEIKFVLIKFNYTLVL